MLANTGNLPGLYGSVSSRNLRSARLVRLALLIVFVLCGLVVGVKNVTGAVAQTHPSEHWGVEKEKLDVKLGYDRELGKLLYNPTLTQDFIDRVYDGYRVEFSSDTDILPTRFIVDVPFERHPPEESPLVRVRIDGPFVIGQMEAVFFDGKTVPLIDRYPPGLQWSSPGQSLVRQTFHSFIFRVPKQAYTVGGQVNEDILNYSLSFRLSEQLSERLREVHGVDQSGELPLRYYEYRQSTGSWIPRNGVTTTTKRNESGRLTVEVRGLTSGEHRPHTGTIGLVQRDEAFFDALEALRQNRYSHFEDSLLQLLNDRSSMNHLLLEASARGRYRAVESLLERGVSLSLNDHLGRSPLIRGSSAGGTQGVKTTDRLIRNGADPSLSDQWGNTPLHVAVRHRNGRVVESLLDAGSPVNQVNEFGLSPLYLAYLWNDDLEDTTIIKKLVDRGARIDVDPKFHPPLSQYVFTENIPAQSIERSNPLIQLLLRAHDRTLEPTGLGKVLPRLISLRRFGFAESLVRKWGVSPNVVTEDGLTPVTMLAVMHEPPRSLAEVLLDAGVDVNTYDENGKTALFYAIRKQNPWFVKLLLEYGADPNQEFFIRSYPLHEAVKSSDGALRKVKYLLQAGADPGYRDADGRTATKVAEDRETSEIVDYLRQADSDTSAGTSSVSLKHDPQ